MNLQVFDDQMKINEEQVTLLLNEDYQELDKNFNNIHSLPINKSGSAAVNGLKNLSCKRLAVAFCSFLIISLILVIYSDYLQLSELGGSTSIFYARYSGKVQGYRDTVEVTTLIILPTVDENAAKAEDSSEVQCMSLY